MGLHEATNRSGVRGGTIKGEKEVDSDTRSRGISHAKTMGLVKSITPGSSPGQVSVLLAGKIPYRPRGGGRAVCQRITNQRGKSRVSCL